MSHFHKFHPVSLAFIALALASTPFLTQAAVSTGIIPFGGRILATVRCNGGADVLLTIGPPRPGLFLFQRSFSVAYRNYMQDRVGPWALGIARPGGICNVTGSQAVIPAEGTILKIGTSLR